MKNLEEFVLRLSQLSEEAPMTAVVLPPKTRGFPVGTYNLQILLNLSADCLEGHKPNCRKGREDNETGIH